VSECQDFAAAKTRHDAWADCLIHAATTLATSTRTTEETAKATFIACKEWEHSMRSHLASFLGATSIVEERKVKALPILNR
jgi:hypothetical protein